MKRLFCYVFVAVFLFFSQGVWALDIGLGFHASTGDASLDVV